LDTKHQKGLTLVECLISMLVLAILLSAGMALYFYAQAGFRWSVHNRIAIEMASAELESIKNSGYASIPLGVWPQSNVTIGNLHGKRDVEVFGMAEYKQVHVVVSWQDAVKSNPSSVSLDTYIAP